MGVTRSRLQILVFLAASLASTAFAEPKLRLSTAALGPISIAAGSNGQQQVVEAYNAGDGSLALAVTSSATWLVPAVGAAAPCTTRSGNCIPINMELRTGSLAAGSQTGIVTVSAPNALDAPQTVTVTVQIGGGVPNRVDLYVAPNGSTDSVRFQTNSQLQTSVTTQSGGSWLSLALDGFGTFRFVWPYIVQGRHLSGLGAGTYNGSINVTGSSFRPDIKNVPVTLRVTSDPIAVVAPNPLQIRVAQNTIKPQAAVVVTNRGVGTLSISGVQVTTASGGSWLAAAQNTAAPSVITVTADPTNLGPGSYQGTIEIASNAANGVQRVPVELQVVAQATPVATYGGVVNNNIFATGEPLAQGTIASLFGDQLSFQAPAGAQSAPLGTELGGTRVLVNGVAAPLYYSSFGQLNFQVPFDAQPGEARIRVSRDGQLGNTVTVQVAQRAPRLLRLGIGDYGIIVNQDGTFPIPPTAGIPSRRARAGDALVIYAIGFGPTNPAVASGAASPGAEPLARLDPVPMVFFGGNLTGGAQATPFFAGLAPGFVGLYQLNVFVPGNAPIDDRVPIRVEGPGYSSNTVWIATQ